MQDFYLDDFWKDLGGDRLLSSLCEGSEIDIRISYTSDFRSAKSLRELVDHICKSFWVAPKWRTRLVLIIDELNNNAIEYGSLKGDTNYFSLKLSRENESTLDIQASVTDTWAWEQSKKAVEMQELREKHHNKDFQKHHSIRWRGLFLIISQLVDTLEFYDDVNGGLTVLIEKSLWENQ